VKTMLTARVRMMLLDSTATVVLLWGLSDKDGRLLIGRTCLASSSKVPVGDAVGPSSCYACHNEGLWFVCHQKGVL
jgi:hypothetical protein